MERVSGYASRGAGQWFWRCCTGAQVMAGAAGCGCQALRGQHQTCAISQ